MPRQRAGSAKTMKGDHPMKFFKNVYCTDPYVAMTAERYARESVTC